MELILGVLFFAAFIYYLDEKGFKRRAYLKAVSKSGINDIDEMKGYQFEDFLLTLFKKKGFTVIQTKASGDFGADLILQRNEKRVVVQAKRYTKKVGIRAVQEAVSALAIYGAKEAWVVTNNYFTDAAVQLAKANSVKLINRDDLMNLIITSNK